MTHQSNGVLCGKFFNTEYDMVTDIGHEVNCDHHNVCYYQGIGHIPEDN